MADPLAQFPMLGSGFNPQLVPNPNAAGASQQQQPPDSMQSIGGLTNPEHSRMWMQMQQQINQQRTMSAGDIVGSQVTLNSFLAPSSSFFAFLSSTLSSFSHFPLSHYYLLSALVFFFFSRHRPPTSPRLQLAWVCLRQQWLLLRFFSPRPFPDKRPCEQPTDFPLFQMVGQQQLQRQPFSVGSGSSLQHNNMLSQFQNNGAINQMTAPQLQAAFQQNRPTPAMLANLQPTQARQLELMMAQQPNPVGLVASRLNPSQPVQQGFPPGMIGGNSNPGQPSQGKPLFYYH